MARFSIVSALTASLLIAGSIAAQFDREMEVPTDKKIFFNFTPAGIGALVNQGYRLSDIEVTNATANSILFSGTAVKNTGDYASGWWWYYGQTPLELLTHANQNGARLIDVERYVVGNSIRYAGVMLSNPGPDPIQWYLWPEVPYADLAGLLGAAQARIIDVEQHVTNGENRMTVLAVKNQGQQAASWWYYVDYSLAHIQNKLGENQARLIDFERIGPNRYAAIMVQDDVGPWWYYYGQSAADVLAHESYHLARTIDVEMYLDGGTPRYLAVMVDNFENFRPYGTGCNAALGVLEHDVVNSNGFLGTNVKFRGRDMTPGSVAVFLLGAVETAIPLDFLGMPGCSLYTDPLVMTALPVGASGVVIQSVPIPNQAALVGGEVFTQFVSLDRSNAAMPLASSNGIATTIRD